MTNILVTNNRCSLAVPQAGQRLASRLRVRSAGDEPGQGNLGQPLTWCAAGGAGLRELFSAIGPGGDLITYCTIGGRAAVAWFVLTHLLGREHVRVCDGSWAEWGRMTDTPVEQPPSEVRSQRAGAV